MGKSIRVRDPVAADVRRLVFVVQERRGQRSIEAAVGRQRHERIGRHQCRTE